MLLLGIDVETGGLDPKADPILELAAVLYDWDRKVPLRLLSELIDPAFDSGGGYQVPAEIVDITGITSEMLSAHGACERDVLGALDTLASGADYYVAHFGNDFDRLFVEAAHEKNGLHLSTAPRGWIDTSIDIKWPPKITTRNLRYLASESGFLNPFAHRAVFDVLTMFEVMKAFDLEQIIARSLEPIVYLEACVTYDDREKAKARGYRWAAGQKKWWKALKSSDAHDEIAECSFETAILPGEPK